MVRRHIKVCKFWSLVGMISLALMVSSVQSGNAQDLFGWNLFLENEFPRIELDDDGEAATIWGVEGGLEIDTAFDINAVTIDGFTLQDTLSASFFGVGIGRRFANEPLHIYSAGDPLDPFPEARLLIENAHEEIATRNMLHLRNQGGHRLILENTASNVQWLMLTQNDIFQLRIQGAQTPNLSFRPSGQFNVTVGGMNRLVLHPNGNLFISGTLFQGSDRDLKENHQPVDSREVLRRVVDTPITTWNYRSTDSEVRHLGPTAQDFREQFGLGVDDRSIATVDANGVALAAIQGLHAELQDRDTRIEQLDRQNAELQQQLEQLTADFQQRLDRLESMLPAQ